MKTCHATIRSIIISKIILLCFTVSLQAQTLSDIESHRVSLPNGWHLTPVGKTLPLGDLPLNIAVSPSGKLAAVTNNGQSTQTIQLIDIKKETILDSIIIGKSWLGLVFSADNKFLYASGGNDNIIIKYAIINSHLFVDDTSRIGKPWPELISVAGLALDDKKNRIYAVTKENNSLYVIELLSKKITAQQTLGGEAYTCILSPDKKTLYVSCWGCDQVVMFDTDLQKISGTIRVGDNP
ncbi:MAG: hypothetical protein QG576_783, partial [Bacteroidota bacterium]|nr:hypothetical protein [Bacteroidota bacterium]